MRQSPSAKTSTTGYPEYAVRRETISRYFSPPLARSTFHDFVNKGKIIPMKEIRGFYLLNASLKRLGLQQVANLPVEPPSRSTEDILSLAFHLLDPKIFEMPTWALLEEELEERDLNHAWHMADMHRAELESLPTIREKLGYASGALQAHADHAAGLFD